MHATHRKAVGHVVIIYRPIIKTARYEYKEMVEDEVCFNSIIEQRMELAAHSLHMSLANMWNYYALQIALDLVWMRINAGHATKSHFPIFQSRFALVEGIPLCIVQTKSTHSNDSFMSIYMQLKTWQNQRFKVSFVKYNMKK